MVAISFKVHNSWLGWPLWSPTSAAIKPNYVTVFPVCTVTKYRRSVFVCVCVCVCVGVCVCVCVRDLLQPTDHFKYTLIVGVVVVTLYMLNSSIPNSILIIMYLQSKYPSYSGCNNEWRQQAAAARKWQFCCLS
jgi:hypothetical protein